MGQKVNPHGLRVGVIKNWDSRWFAKDEVFGDTLVSDYNIRKYLKKELKFQGFVRDNKFNKNTRFHIESNQKIEGHIYILDKEINEYIEAQNIFSCYGIPGFTKWNWS